MPISFVAVISVGHRISRPFHSKLGENKNFLAERNYFSQALFAQIYATNLKLVDFFQPGEIMKCEKLKFLALRKINICPILSTVKTK